MKKFVQFDLLIVYAHSLARSASGNSDSLAPFPKNSSNALYNTVYGYFLDICHRYKLSAAFTTSADIIGPGYCQSFWKFKNNCWTKFNSPCYSSLIFDKFSPTNANIRSRRQLLFSQAQVKPYNDPSLYNLFFDKLYTYNQLSDFSIPTVSIAESNLQGIKNACRTLSKLMAVHPGSADFSSDIVMKDRYGAGGRFVYKFNSGQYDRMLNIINRHKKISFIIQPFAIFDRGFSYQNRPASTDIRFIYLGGKIIQSYIRVAKPGDFRCNEHQGGRVTYLSPKDIPPSLVTKSNLIAQILDKSCSLFALDFIITNSGNAYLLEGNTGPGLDWNQSLTKNTFEAKKLIRLIVKELSFRVLPQTVNFPQTTYVTPSPIVPQPLFPAEFTPSYAVLT